MLQFFAVIAACFVVVIFLDWSLGAAIRWLAPVLPDELAGRDGWLVDTRRGSGVFDCKSV